MKQQKADRRSQRTHRLVSAAFGELLGEKPYEKILCPVKTFFSLLPAATDGKNDLATLLAVSPRACELSTHSRRRRAQR